MELKRSVNLNIQITSRGGGKRPVQESNKRRSRITFWPKNCIGSEPAGTYEYFCGILLYTVQRYYFHPLHPSDYHYMWKVTFGEGSKKTIGTNKLEDNGDQITIVYRTVSEPIIRGETLVTIKRSDYKNYILLYVWVLKLF